MECVICPTLRGQAPTCKIPSGMNAQPQESSPNEPTSPSLRELTELQSPSPERTIPIHHYPILSKLRYSVAGLSKLRYSITQEEAITIC